MKTHFMLPALIILAFGLINASACLLRCTSWKSLTSIIFKFKQGWFENFSHGHWRWAIIQTNECKNAFQLDVNQKANLLNAMLALLSGEGSGLIMRKSPVQIGPPSISTYTHFHHTVHPQRPLWPKKVRTVWLNFKVSSTSVNQTPYKLHSEHYVISTPQLWGKEVFTK